ncbi:MAG: glycosyltransferase [Candidatus Omnitrophica bacterium]|nr:glycosyltransferase [Candidatus Omnitrophota bacterium]
MNILLINPYDIHGGAEKIVCSLCSIYNEVGHKAFLFVNRKISNYQFVMEFPQPRISAFYEFFHKINQRYSRENYLKKLLRQFEKPGTFRKIFTGRETWNYVNFDAIIADRLHFKPDILHFHNLHNRFINPYLLFYAYTCFPVLITLHDMWLLTGKCIQPGNCEKWKTGCEDCPESWFPSFIVRYGIRKNLQEKIQVIKKIRPYVCTPSQWAMEIVRKSPVEKFVRGLEVINNGVNLSVFKPGNKKASRRKLNLQENAVILLSSGRDLKTNRYKNFKNLRKVALILKDMHLGDNVVILCLGEKGKTEFHGNVEIRFIPFINDDVIVAEFYRAADIYISTAEYETWGLAITEAMACGTPVVAFSAGGIKEQVINGKTGFLIPGNDTSIMAQTIKKLITNEILLKSMSEASSMHVKKNFDIKNTASKYLQLYAKILNETKKNRH